MSQKSNLPPLPKLRPKPGLQPWSATFLTATTFEGEEEQPIAPPSSTQHSDFDLSSIKEDSRTSRLLTKNDCRASGGRKRQSGSIIHSIPKFSQVQPHGGCISEVQKVLQSRLLEKQRRKNFSQSKSMEESTTSPDMKASSILQNFAQLHERASLSDDSSGPVTSSSRKRKPDKSEICHLVPAESNSSKKTLSLIDEKPVSFILPNKNSPKIDDKPVNLVLPFKNSSNGKKEKNFVLPQLTEVTITPAAPKYFTENDSKRPKCSSSPEIIEISSNSTNFDQKLSKPSNHLQIPPVLKPEEYHFYDTPPGYIFWQPLQAFVHLSAIPHNYLEHFKTTAPTMQPIKSNDSMESLTGVMKVRPFKSSSSQLDGLSKDERIRATNIEQSPEVSICKFKFTGGENPSLEEKKMLSVDSDGNFRYFTGNASRSIASGSGQQKKSKVQENFEATFQKNLSEVLIERVPGHLKRPSLASADIFSAFESIPEMKRSSIAELPERKQNS